MVDSVGDTAAAGLALCVRAPLGDAGALAGGEEGAPVRFRRKRAPGGQRREEPDQDRLMDEIDRQAVPAGEAYRARRRRLGSPTVRPLQPCQDARQARDAEAKEDDPRPWQKRAPVERIRQRLAKPEPQEPGRIEQGRAAEPRRNDRRETRRRDLPRPGAITNGPARRLATAMQWRMPKVMGSLGAKTKLPPVTSAAAPATIARRRQKARTFSPLRWASASDTPTRARKTLATLCDKSRICGVNGSIGEASRKSARSQLKW